MIKCNNKLLANNLNILVAILISIVGHFFVFIFLVINNSENTFEKVKELNVNLTKKTTRNNKKIETINNVVNKKENKVYSSNLKNIENTASKINTYKNITHIESRYYLRSEVSIPAEIISEIILEFPDDFYSKDNVFIVKVSIYVNEIGDVDYIEFEENNLPISLKHVAANVLSLAKFKAAEIDHSFVKSKIRLEIVFSS